jgi:transmembrane protein EpsG
MSKALNIFGRGERMSRLAVADGAGAGAKLYAHWNQRSVWFALIGLLLFDALFPFAGFYTLLLVVTLTSGVHSPRREIVGLLCVASVIVIGPLLALKLPLDNGGNDKIQYLDFMRTMGASGITHYMVSQPEVLSFSTLYLAWALFGPTDFAFLFIFGLSFWLLLIAVWRIEYRAIPLFLLLFTSSAAFYNSYGNVIRQAMAFPFMFLLFSCSKSRGRVAFVLLAGLAHLPSLLIGAPYVAYRLFRKWAVWTSIFVAGAILVVSSYNMQALNSMSGGDGYMSKKIGLYSAWDSYSVATVAAVATAIFIINNVVWKKINLKISAAKDRGAGFIEALWVASNFAFLGMVATYNLSKVFERVYIYFFSISLVYLSVAISRSRRGPTKTLVLIGAMAYSTYGLMKNLQLGDLLFAGDPIGYLTASFLDLYRNFI